MVHLLMAMAPPIVLILIVTLIFAAALSSRLTKRLVRPILELDLERPEDSEVYDELSPLLTRIRRQNDTIRAQMDQLRQQKQEFTALTENMSEGFLLLDAKGRVLSYNTGVLRLLGAAAPAEEASVLTLDRSDVFQQLVEQVLDGRRSQVRMERAGRILQLLGDPVLRDGETAGAVLVLLDVTEREQAEQMRREFSANVSHELKTPLTSISGMAEIMKDGLVKQEDIRGFAADIYQESQRLIRLVEDILHLSRLDEGGGGLERQEIDLLDLARTVEDRLQSTAKQHQVELELTGDHAAIQGLPSVVEEMVYNLCDNAIKYNRPGGEASVRVEDGADAVTVTVSDTGIGIPPEDRERVFERFYRVDKSHSRPSAAPAWVCPSSSTGPPSTTPRWSWTAPPGRAPRCACASPRSRTHKAYSGRPPRGRPVLCACRGRQTLRMTSPVGRGLTPAAGARRMALRNRPRRRTASSASLRSASSPAWQNLHKFQKIDCQASVKMV